MVESPGQPVTQQVDTGNDVYALLLTRAPVLSGTGKAPDPPFLATCAHCRMVSPPAAGQQFPGFVSATRRAIRAPQEKSWYIFPDPLWPSTFSLSLPPASFWWLQRQQTQRSAPLGGSLRHFIYFFLALFSLSSANQVFRFSIRKKRMFSGNGSRSFAYERWPLSTNVSPCTNFKMCTCLTLPKGQSW